MQSATLDTARRALHFISPSDRDTWVRMGMALKDEFGDEAYDVWIDWSQGAESFDAKAAKSVWRSFKIAGKLGIGSLFAEAKAKGFEFDKTEAEPTPEQIAARLADKEARRLKQIAEEKRRVAAAQSAAKRAASQWRMAALVGESPYLYRKRVGAENCRFLAHGAIIIPMIRYDKGDDAFVGKQQINADGSKKYSSGMDKQGAMCRLGTAPIDGTLIYVCEGYATGLSIREALFQKASVFVCFDTSNLLAGAKILRSMYAKSQIIFCADDDYLTGEAGRKKAEEAARVIGNARVFLPTFTTARRQSKDDLTLPMLTDCNDLHVSEGLDVLARSLDEFLMFEPSPSIADQSSDAENGVMPPVFPADAEADSPPPLQDDVPENKGLVPLNWALAHCSIIQGTTDVWDVVNGLRMRKQAFVAMVGKDNAKAWEAHPDRRSIHPKKLPKITRGVAKTPEGGGDGMLDMLDRYTLLYGTKTVWDESKKVIINFDALQLARGDLAGRWLEHPLRKEKDHDKLVFDPTQKVDLETHINMFEGFPLTPKHDEYKAGLSLQLLQSLCSSEPNCDELFEWVLKWLAYPLQHPGAKMQTALLFFGEKQGTGKSLFFEGIIKPIYGRHGVTGNQTQLDANYSMWRSQKLYVVFEEILSRQDKYSSFGLVKHLITGRDTPITQKFRDDRFENNYMNGVLLSNEHQAVPLEPNDRRFVVCESKNYFDSDLLKEIVDSKSGTVREGISEAFYDFLLRLPLDDFGPHAKPPMTESKRRMIEFGRPDWEVFYLSWSAGELSFPYCSCLSQHLFLAYEKFCSKYNFRALSLKKFSEWMLTRLQRDRQWVQIGLNKKQLLSVFHVPSDTTDTLSKQCNDFMKAAGIVDDSL